jgi:hypothetical protein
MKLELLNDPEYQKRFNEISFLNQYGVDNDLKVKYSEKILALAGENFEVSPPLKKTQKMKSGECYMNAIKKMERGFGYVEGVITDKLSGMKVNHAWNVNHLGQHFDFTILNPHEYDYKGIIIPKFILYDVGYKNGCIWYCCLPYLAIGR